jgi:Domain of unknown function (DUF4157)
MTTLANRSVALPAQKSGTSFAAGLLQRKCSCGTAKSSVDENCEKCRSRRLQRQLAIGASHDAFEIEADQVAEQVLKQAVPAEPAVPLAIRRVPLPHAVPNDTAPVTVERVLAQSGAPLEPELRADMERRFGHDFGAVRIHRGTEADRSTRDVSALAYTVGTSIVFGDGQFAPATPAGRRLLAHELTHVVQQGGSTDRLSARHVQRDKVKREAIELPEPIRDDEARYIYRSWFVRAPLRSNVQWHFDRLIPGSFLLLVSTTAKEREQLKKEKKGASWVARFCSEQIRIHIGLNFTHGGTELVDYLATYLHWLFEHPTWDWFSIAIGVSSEMMRRQFNADEYDAYIEALRPAFTPTDFSPLLTYADLDIFFDQAKPGPKHNKLAPWVAAKKNQLDALIKKLRSQGHDRPVDLPDEVVAWFNERDASWYLNVWVWFDTSGKSKKGHAIKLQEGEPVEKLLERTRTAVQKAVDKQSAEDDQKREREFPRWARKLKDDLDRAVRIATGGKKTDDAPDGTTLTFGSPGLKTQGPDESAPTATVGVDAPPQVMLTIWVQRGEEHVEKNQGSVPIFETTALAQLVPYVRQLAAVLRQFEHTPGAVAVKPWQQADKLTLPAFEAYILPQDLRPDHITVTGARNKFGMFLDFEKQYNMIVDPTGLGVASKLYNQAIFFEWKVYQVPGSAPKREGEEDNWPERWKALYLQYNPTGLAEDGKQIATAPSAASPVTEPPVSVYEARGDISDRVRFNDEPGEYLVSCQTLSAPVGKSDLTRSSSRAYYPVRTEPMTSIVGPLVTQTTAELEQVAADLKQIETALKLENIDENERKVLLATKTSKQAHKKVLETKETSGLVATTRAEIADAEARLKAAERLDKKLPGLIETAKANEGACKEPTEPSKMIEDDPELLAVYWQTLSDKVSVNLYARTLTKQIKDLNEVYKRAVEFSNEFRGEESGACVYSPEAVFLSELDGHIYPLVLMVGEAKNKVTGAKVSYRLADVTSPQTQKVYYGYSFKDGPEGHLEAIDKAFEDFGESATYGEGWIAVRMPKGRDECANLHRQGIHAYESKEGIPEKVWKFLGFIAAAAGIAALVATGVGAGAAAALLGVLAAGVGAAVSIHNIVDRSRRHTLKADAELAMDILGIVGLAEIGAAKGLAYLPKAVRGFAAAESFGRFMAVYRVGVEAASFVLIPIKLQEDIAYIRALPISDAEKEEMVRAAFGEALTGILMVAASSIGARAAHGGAGKRAPMEEDLSGMRQQAELLSLEHADNYKSMSERGWIDENGAWTESAPDPMRRQRTKALEGGAPKAHPSTEPPPKAALEAVERVNSGEVEVHGKKPGERYADMGDGHQVAEVPTGMGVSCEYHSKNRIEVSCPLGMGSKPTRQQKAEAEATQKAAEKRWEKLNESGEIKKARDEKRAELEAKRKDEPKAVESAPIEETPDALKAVRKAKREQQHQEVSKAKERLNQKLDDARDLVIQFENEIQQTERKLKKSMPLKSRKKLEADLEDLRFKKERAQEMRAPIEQNLADVEVTPYDRARRYSYSDAAGDAIVARARGRDEMSGLPIREPSIDHIVPVNDIVEMPGYNKLRPDEQGALLSHEDNLVLMERELNSAKQDKRWSQWDGGRRKYGNDVADRMIIRERELRDALSKKIVAMLEKRGLKP